MLRKAAYFTAVAAEAWSSLPSAQRESLAMQNHHLWLLATRLYTRTPNPLDGSAGNYGWATLRALCLDGLSCQGSTELSLEASEQLLSLLGKLEPDLPLSSHNATVYSDEGKEEEPLPVVLPDESNKEPDVVVKDAPRAAVNVDDTDVQDALSTANQFAKNLRTSYNTLTVGSSLLVQQAKWAGEAPIPSIEVPLSHSSPLSSMVITLKAVWPNMSYSTVSMAQKRCMERATVLRRAIPTSSVHVDTAARYGLFDKELPLFISSNVAILPQPALELECIKKRVPVSSETGGTGMETFYNPFAKKSAADGPLARVAEGEERALLVTFGNRLSLPLQILRSEVIFDRPSAVQVTAVSFSIPPNDSSFAVRYPFRMISDRMDSAPVDVRLFNVKGIQLTCLGRELFLPIHPVKKPVVNPTESVTMSVPKTPLEKKGKKSVLPRVESYPCQPKLEIVYADTKEAVPDVILISLTDSEVCTLPTWQLKNCSGSGMIGQIEALELVLLGTLNRKLFDSSVERQPEMTEDLFVEDMLYKLDPPPFKVRALTGGLNLDDVNVESGSSVTIQIAAAYNLKAKLSNKCTFDLHVRYRGTAMSTTEVWRKRVISFRIVHSPGPRIASVSFRPDLAADRAFYDDILKQWTHSAEIGTGANSSMDATDVDSQMILTAVGQHPCVDVCGDRSFFTLTVSNETRAVLSILRKPSNLSLYYFPWSEMVIHAGLSTNIPMEMSRIPRVDENGAPRDVWTEFARQTTLLWESRDSALGHKRRGYLRIPPDHWKDIVLRYPAVISHVCTPPCSITMQVDQKNLSEAAIVVPMGYPITVSMSVTFAPWIPSELWSNHLVTMEVHCQRNNDDVETMVAPGTHCDFVGAGQWERRVRPGDATKSHVTKIAFGAVGRFSVSASVRMMNGATSMAAPEEIWWAPVAQAIHVVEAHPRAAQ